MEPSQDSEKLSQNPETTSTSNGQVEQKNLIISRQPSYMRASVSGVFDGQKNKRHGGFFSTFIFFTFICAIVATFIWIFWFDGKYMFSTFPLKKVYSEKYSMLVPLSYQQGQVEKSGDTEIYNFVSAKNSNNVVQSISVSVGDIVGDDQSESARLSSLANASFSNYKSMTSVSDITSKHDKSNGKDRYIVKFENKLENSTVIKKVFVYTSGGKYTCALTISFLNTEKNMSENYTDIINSLKVN